MGVSYSTDLRRDYTLTLNLKSKDVNMEYTIVSGRQLIKKTVSGINSTHPIHFTTDIVTGEMKYGESSCGQDGDLLYLKENLWTMTDSIRRMIDDDVEIQIKKMEEEEEEEEEKLEVKMLMKIGDDELTTD